MLSSDSLNVSVNEAISSFLPPPLTMVPKVGALASSSSSLAICSFFFSTYFKSFIKSLRIDATNSRDESICVRDFIRSLSLLLFSSSTSWSRFIASVRKSYESRLQCSSIVAKRFFRLYLSSSQSLACSQAIWSSSMAVLASLYSLSSSSMWASLDLFSSFSLTDRAPSTVEM